MRTLIAAALVAASLAPATAGPACDDQLWSEPPEAQWACIEHLQAGPADASRGAVVAALLDATGQEQTPRILAAMLDAARIHGPATPELAQVVADTLLTHSARALQGRDKLQVMRLRAYAFAVLARIGVPDSALPLLVDDLAYTDERMPPFALGAAARAAGTLGPKGGPLVPFLARSVGEINSDEQFSLDRYDLRFPAAEATTVNIEVARALGALATPVDTGAVQMLESVSAMQPGILDTRFIAAAADALTRIRARTESPAALGPLGTIEPWLPPAERDPLGLLDIGVTDHAGRTHILGALLDRPVLFTFFFTGCESGRCPVTVARLAAIQQDLRERGTAGEVRLLAITLQPQFESPNDLRAYAVERGLDLGDDALSVKLDPARHDEFMARIKAPVAYNSGWVTSHGVEAFIVDRDHGLARKYGALALVANETILRDIELVVSGR